MGLVRKYRCRSHVPRRAGQVHPSADPPVRSPFFWRRLLLLGRRLLGQGLGLELVRLGLLQALDQDLQELSVALTSEVSVQRLLSRFDEACSLGPPKHLFVFELVALRLHVEPWWTLAK